VRRLFKGLANASMEVFAAFLAVLGGLPILLNPGVYAPTTVLALFPIPIVFVWGAFLVAGGLLMLAGIALNNVYVNRAGLLLLASGSFVMGTSIFLFTGVTRLLTVGIYYLFAWAMFARYQQLSQVLKARRRIWRDLTKRNKEE